MLPYFDDTVARFSVKPSADRMFLVRQVKMTDQWWWLLANVYLRLFHDCVPLENSVNVAQICPADKIACDRPLL